MNHFPQVMDAEDVFESGFRLLVGAEVGRGHSRTVYDCFLVEGCVVKVENRLYNFNNVLEWQVWGEVFHTKWARWFAHCRYISREGRVLIQEKTRPPRKDEWPTEIPAFLTDIKRENFGMVTRFNEKLGYDEELFVCHDYAMNLLLNHGLSKKMAKWDFPSLEA